MTHFNDLPMQMGHARYVMSLDKVSRYKGPFGKSGFHIYEPEYVAAQARTRKINKRPRPAKFSRICSEMMVGQNAWVAA